MPSASRTGGAAVPGARTTRRPAATAQGLRTARGRTGSRRASLAARASRRSVPTARRPLAARSRGRSSRRLRAERWSGVGASERREGGRERAESWRTHARPNDFWMSIWLNSDDDKPGTTCFCRVASALPPPAVLPMVTGCTTNSAGAPDQSRTDATPQPDPHAHAALHHASDAALALRGLPAGAAPGPRAEADRAAALARRRGGQA